MVKLFGRDWTRGELLRKVGNISQVGGVELVELQEGRAQGLRAVRVRTGVAEFTALAGRCLDVYDFSYQGASLAWHAPGEVAAAPYFEDVGLRFVRTFPGGMFVTGGLTTIGAPSVDQGEELGLHGRVHSLPATAVAADGRWEGDDYVMAIEGRVRQSALFGENLVLRRRITARLGEAKILVKDVVENEGHATTPHMILYHVNTGFPLVDEGSRVVTTSKVAPRMDPASEQAVDKWAEITGPVPGIGEVVFWHDVATDAAGQATAAIVNDGFAGGQGLGFYVRFSKATLPYMYEWKMMGEGTYVVGLEPANGLFYGRATERAAGRLEFLEPGERREYSLELGVLPDRQSIAALEQQLQALGV